MAFYFTREKAMEARLIDHCIADEKIIIYNITETLRAL